MQANHGQNISLTFENFSIERNWSGGTSCYDYVEIVYESFSRKYCGITTHPTTTDPYIPGPFNTSHTTMTVKFHTDDHVTSTGFLAVICCSVNVSTNFVGECQVKKLDVFFYLILMYIRIIIYKHNRRTNNINHHNNIHDHDYQCYCEHWVLRLRSGKETDEDSGRSGDRGQ